MPNSISFFLNGEKTIIEKPAVDMLLIDYLRSPTVHLSGPKKPCGQGGCGGCTVILSNWNSQKGTEEHLAINSCLRPLVSVDGMVVTTVEGTGAARRPNPEYLTHTPIASRGGAPATAPLAPLVMKAFAEAQTKRAAVFEAVSKAETEPAQIRLLATIEKAEHPSEVTQLGVNPVAHRLAMNNGTQCGYCTVGFVMNMTEFIANNPHATQKEIEDIFDGNICRCTGYRPILTGMKTFASDWTLQDEKERMECIGDDSVKSQLPASYVVIPFPDAARKPLQSASIHNGEHQWIRPDTLASLIKTLVKFKKEKPFIIHANTAFGIYKEDFLNAKVIVDIRLVPELNAPVVADENGIKVSAGTTYSSFIQTVEEALARYQQNIPQGRDVETLPWGAALFMAKRTAGRIVRNAASLGGNTMLVLKHIAQGTGQPFPSDLFTALAACHAIISYIDPYLDEAPPLQEDTIEALCNKVVNDPALAERMLLVGYYIPFGEKQEVVLAQKVALRDVNAHSIINAGSSILVDASLKVQKATLVFGGVAPYPWHAVNTESLMQGEVLSLDIVPGLLLSLVQETKAALDQWKHRLEGLPDEGFTDDYRIQLVTAMFYKAVVNALIENGGHVPVNIRSGGKITWGRWPVSNGHQYYQSQNFKAPVTKPYVKFTAMEQASGQLHYTHEYAVPVNTVNGALVQSKRALANYFFIVPGKGRVTTAELRSHLSNTFPLFYQGHRHV